MKKRPTKKSEWRSRHRIVMDVGLPILILTIIYLIMITT